MPSLVPHADLASAVAINSVIFNLARFVGPACAGPTIVWSGVSGAFAANAASYLVFLVALARIRVPFADDAPVKRRSMIADLGEGMRYTASHPGIAALLVLLTALGIGGRPLSELLPGFAAEKPLYTSRCSGSETGLGRLEAAQPPKEAMMTEIQNNFMIP